MSTQTDGQNGCINIHGFLKVFRNAQVFYVDICGVVSRDKSLYETRVLDNIYLRFKVQPSTSDSIEITAGGPKNTLEGPVPQDDPQRKKIIP